MPIADINDLKIDAKFNTKTATTKYVPSATEQTSWVFTNPSSL